MMFQTGNIKAPAAKKPEPETGATMVFGQSPLAKPAAPAAPAKPAAKAAEPDSGATMVFGQSPIAPKTPAKPSTAAKAVANDDGAGSTMMFGASPVLARTATPAPPVREEPAAEEEAAPAPPDRAAPAEAAEPESAGPPPEEPSAPSQDEDRGFDEPSRSDSGVEAEGAEEETAATSPGTFDKAPPKGLLIGVAAGLAALLVAGGALVAVKKLGKRPPPQAAVDTLTTAQTEADKDSLASIAAAEAKAKDALDVAGPKARFPEATAALARIEVQWADALNDQAALLGQKGGDGAEAKAAELQTQAKAKLKTAFEALSPAVKADQKSPDLEVALADYYRAQRSGSNMNKALKTAQALKADDAKVSFVQGMAAAQEDDGAEKAIPKLKMALAGNPQSARVHFRLALAYLAIKDEANAKAELKETLKLSPQHERAKAVSDQLATASADGK